MTWKRQMLHDRLRPGSLEFIVNNGEVAVVLLIEQRVGRLVSADVHIRRGQGHEDETGDDDCYLFGAPCVFRGVALRGMDVWERHGPERGEGLWLAMQEIGESWTTQRH